MMCWQRLIRANGGAAWWPGPAWMLRSTALVSPGSRSILRICEPILAAVALVLAFGALLLTGYMYSPVTWLVGG